MKSILYVGAALMVSAGIYGFVDYNKTNKSKEFKNLYREVEPTTTVKTTEAIPDEKIEEVKAIEPVNKKVKAAISPAKPELVVNIKKATVVKKKAVKKFSYKQFSRARPAREFTEEIILPPPPPVPPTENKQ